MCSDHGKPTGEPATTEPIYKIVPGERVRHGEARAERRNQRRHPRLDRPGRGLDRRLERARSGDGVTARVIAGRCHGVVGAVERVDTEPLYLDLHLAAGASFEQPLPPAESAAAKDFMSTPVQKCRSPSPVSTMARVPSAA